MKKVIMMMMFSMSIMGQVLINPFEPVELVTPIVTTPILYINPCTTTQNACFFSFNSTCVYDGEGEYHCECDDGYVHSDPDNDKSTCIDPCTGSCDIYNTSEQEVYCSSNLIGGQAICLQDNDTVAADCIQNPNDPKCGGVLLCSEENLGGVCKIFTESINDFSLTWYYQTSDLGGGAITSLPKSATVVNSKWEFYTLMERFFDIYNIGNVKIATGGNKSYTNSSSDIVNFNTTSDNETNVFVIQPTNKIEFKNYFGDQTPYLAVEKKGIYGEILGNLLLELKPLKQIGFFLL
jgi:hypothetical protein